MYIYIHIPYLVINVFCSRWNNYKSNGKKYLVGESCIPEHIFEHFSSESQTGFL